MRASSLLVQRRLHPAAPAFKICSISILLCLGHLPPACRLSSAQTAAAAQSSRLALTLVRRPGTSGRSSSRQHIVDQSKHADFLQHDLVPLAPGRLCRPAVPPSCCSRISSPASTWLVRSSFQVMLLLVLGDGRVQGARPHTRWRFARWSRKLSLPSPEFVKRDRQSIRAMSRMESFLALHELRILELLAARWGCSPAP